MKRREFFKRVGMAAAGAAIATQVGIANHDDGPDGEDGSWAEGWEQRSAVPIVPETWLPIDYAKAFTSRSQGHYLGQLVELDGVTYTVICLEDGVLLDRPLEKAHIPGIVSFEKAARRLGYNMKEASTSLQKFGDSTIRFSNLSELQYASLMLQ